MSLMNSTAKKKPTWEKYKPKAQFNQAGSCSHLMMKYKDASIEPASSGKTMASDGVRP
jgi:hypothetical protein